ncbi:MAG: DEAD/DEAH box helicase [Bacteroidetes bacterium]|nr:DEAD/DEAH box helicase [Bacteroidota bacterium]
MSINLLSEPIRKFIREKRWDELRPIQLAAITRILSTDLNYILASKTASGKTEAAFLPILSKVNFDEPGVQVLYISPLIALINDQFIRIEDLCKYMDVIVTKWHGEANKSLKEKIIKEPQGIILITPESLEAMFVNKPYNVKQLFSNLKYIVIDEIHSFIGTDRGVQLKSILSRLQDINYKFFNIVGLSATIGDYEEAKRFTGNVEQTKVLLDRGSKDTIVQFRYFPTDKIMELPAELIENLYEETKDNKVLIFPNSRGRAEEVAVELKRIAGKKKGHQNYFSHHSSVDREVREYVEHFAKNNKRESFCISCTSTLELGIDIGTVDEVVQIDSTNSIASLIQRVGRSGRRNDESSNLFVYATRPWSLLQSLACWLLYKEGFIEPPQTNDKPYDILLHQILSIVKGFSGISQTDLINRVTKNFAFTQISSIEVEEIITHLLQIDFLEKIQHDIIIGLSGEKIVNSREFYSVFKTEENLKVVHAGNTIGEIPFSPMIFEDQNILLAARMWKIKSVDFKSKRIEVIKANDGKKPLFFGTGGYCHSMIREKIYEILFSNQEYEIIDEAGKLEIENLQKEFSVFPIKDINTERPLKINDKKLSLYTFAGTRINNTIGFLLNVMEIPNSLNDSSSSFDIESSRESFYDKWGNILQSIAGIDKHITDFLESNPGILDFSKWGLYLPVKYQVQLLKQKYFDFQNAEELITSCRLVENKE